MFGELCGTEVTGSAVITSGVVRDRRDRQRVPTCARVVGGGLADAHHAAALGQGDGNADPGWSRSAAYHSGVCLFAFGDGSVRDVCGLRAPGTCPTRIAGPAGAPAGISSRRWPGPATGSCSTRTAYRADPFVPVDFLGPRSRGPALTAGPRLSVSVRG